MPDHCPKNQLYEYFDVYVCIQKDETIISSCVGDVLQMAFGI